MSSSSTQSPETVLFIRAADNWAPCVDYTMRLFATLAGTRVQCLSPEQALAANAVSGGQRVVVYVPEREVPVFWNALPEALRASAHAVAVGRSDFWKTFSPPIGVAPPADLQPAIQAVLGKNLKANRDDASMPTIIQRDLLAVCFWIVTRAEEYSPAAKRDAHQRFLSSSSAVPGAAYDQPIVCHALLLLAGELGIAAAAGTTGLNATQNVAITHDIDLLRKYRGTAGARRMLGRIAKEPGRAVAEMKAGLPLLMGKGRDPYDSFDALFAVKERISAPSTWFIMTEQGGHNADYNLRDPQLRNVLIQSRNYHDEVGLHSSWQSGTSAETLSRERAAIAKNTSGQANGVRPHYLRFTMPETWRHMAHAGFRYSSSMGFPDRAGFRCGWSGPFRPFDLFTMQELSIIEIPLVCMDMTLSVYEKVPAELSLERLTNLLDASCEGIPGGAFVFLWHNTIADRWEHPGYWGTFEYFFSIASGSSTFLTLNQLCDQYEARAGAVR